MYLKENRVTNQYYLPVLSDSIKREINTQRQPEISYKNREEIRRKTGVDHIARLK